MKRSPMPRRKKYMPRFNARRNARVRAQYAAFLRSALWKAIRRDALTRAGHRCEMRLTGGERCPMTERLTVHHMTYRRFGGNELPNDLKVLCAPHHDAVEASKPCNRRRRAS